MCNFDRTHRIDITMAEVRRRNAKEKSEAGDNFLQVVVPTYNETENIRPLCERLFKVARKQ